MQMPLTRTRSTTSLSPCLQHVFAHPRDARISFDAGPHVYHVQHATRSFTSVTTWNHAAFAPFDSSQAVQSLMRGRNWNASHPLWGLTADEIQRTWKTSGEDASRLGTELHDQIECFLNEPRLVPPYTHAQLPAQPDPSERVEWNQFLQFVRDHPTWTPYRTEWRVFSEAWGLAGSIDMVYRNEDGSVSIVDWKRVKAIAFSAPWRKYSTEPGFECVPDTNGWHYTCQLNTYRALLEEEYGLRVRDLTLVQFHPDLPGYQLFPVPLLGKAFYDRLAARAGGVRPRSEPLNPEPLEDTVRLHIRSLTDRSEDRSQDQSEDSEKEDELRPPAGVLRLSIPELKRFRPTC
jgi:hypothetical protein